MLGVGGGVAGNPICGSLVVAVRYFGTVVDILGLTRDLPLLSCSHLICQEGVFVQLGI